MKQAAEISEENIPIDIHSGKLLDWLISRRLCNRTWPNEVQLIRVKINNAIQDMPAVDEVTKLLSGTHINYFHCLKIVEILKKTEVDSKNIFGYYSSQRMKDWQEIVKLYEKNSIYLAEAAQMLIRNTSYEVPSIRKQVTKCKQVQEECSRKEVDYSRNMCDFKDQYNSTCQQIGIKGENIKKELVELLKDLPSIYEEIAESCKPLADARSYYQDFVSFTVISDNITAKCLPVLSHIMQKGNTTTYEYKYNEKPISVEEPNCEFQIDDKKCSDDAIDFGNEQIDFGLPPPRDSVSPANDTDVSSSDSNGWKVVDMPKVEEIDFGPEDFADNAEIDFGIIDSADLGITLEGSGTDGGVAKGNEALSVLDNSEMRAQFLNDLLELESFLDQRYIEMNKDVGMLGVNQFQTAPSSLLLQTPDNIESMVKIVRKITSKMNSPKVQQLCLIKSSFTYVDRLTESLSRKLQLVDKAEKSLKRSVEKRNAAEKEQKILFPKIELIIEKTKMLQKQIEQEISKKYKNRPVNLMGGVNTL